MAAKTKDNEPKDAAGRLSLKAKRNLVKTLERQIVSVRENAEAEIVRLKNRIFVAQTLADALEKGTIIKAKHLDRK